MTKSSIPRVVRDYLAELDRELAGVPDDVREGIVTGIAEELEGLDAAAATSRIGTLGDPPFIAAEARADAALQSAGPQSAGPQSAGPRWTAAVLAPPRASEQRWYVVVTTALLYFGGLVVPLAGWVVGIMLLWASPLWTRREKLIAAIVPSAVGVVLFGLLALVGSRFGVWHALVLGGLVGPFLTSIVIGIVLSRRGWLRAGA
jgi:hypothetical protein